MLEACDTLLMVGSGFPFTEFLPPPGQARGVQIDLAGRMLSLRYPMEVALVGDSAETLRALLPLLEARSDSWRPWIEEQVIAWWHTAEERAQQPAHPLNPQLVFHALSPRLPDGCIVTGDSGSSTVWYARHLKLRRGMRASLSGTLATMGSAIPYALAAKYAYPDRVVIATAGDGALQMSGLGALIDIARAWRRWSDPRLIVLVLNNRELNYVTWEQRVMEGEPKFPVSQDIPDFPYARYAELLELRGVRVDSPGAVAAAWDEALAADRPVVVEAVTDPNVPTVPPQLKPEQEQKLRRALKQGDPAAVGVLRQARAEGVLRQ
jgi:pyruvate dehydrogenase (quinone)